MVRCPRLLAFLPLIVALSLGSPAPASSPRSLVATVQHVADGDFITALSDNNTTLRIRLLGIDAPEASYNGRPGQPFGEEARDYLDHLIGGKTVYEKRMACKQKVEWIGRLTGPGYGKGNPGLEPDRWCKVTLPPRGLGLASGAGGCSAPRHRIKGTSGSCIIPRHGCDSRLPKGQGHVA